MDRSISPVGVGENRNRFVHRPVHVCPECLGVTRDLAIVSCPDCEVELVARVPIGRAAGGSAVGPARSVAVLRGAVPG